MKQIKKRWLGLVIAPALFALLGFASSANATSYTSCASVPPTVSGDADITDTACVFANDVSASGHISVTATSIVATNLTASNGAITLTSSNGPISTGIVSAAYGPSSITSSGASGTITTQNVTVSNGEMVITSSGAITTDNITTTNGQLKLQTTGGAINTKVLTANNAYIDLDSSDLIKVVGTTTSTNYDVTFKAVKDIQADAISSGRNIKITSTTDKINLTSTVDSNVGDISGGNILLTATKSIATGAISTHGNTKTGAVEINAYKDANATAVFTVGSTGKTNGVNGTINTSSVSGGGTNPSFITGGVFITNGNAGSTGGIKITTMTDILVTATASRSGLIFLNAQNGTLTLPTGKLNADAGAVGQGAGYIVLLAKTITTVNGTIISANQDPAATSAGTNHGAFLAAETLNVAGASGVVVQADGNGTAGGPATAALGPKGSITLTSNDNIYALTWTVSLNGLFTTDAPLTVAGAAPLKMTANGSRSRVYVSGHPMTFNNKTVTLQARGATDHEVSVSYYGAITGSQGITFNTTGAVAIDANGFMNTGDTTVAGGKVSIYGDKMTFNATTHTFSANGPTSGNGDSGTVFVGSSFITLSPTSKVTVTANAATAGTGNSILGDTTTSDPKAIEFYPGSTIDIGTAVGQYSFSAKGGSTGGHGGTVVISAAGATLKTASAIDASARAGNSDGGEIRFYNYINSIDPSATVSAIGKGSGKGGKFTAYHTIVDIDILKFVKVDGGTSVAATDFDGSITLNNVPCRQWKLSGTQAWPKTHWVCTLRRDAPDNYDKAASVVALSAAFNGLRTEFSSASHKVNIFVFDVAADFNSFYYDFVASNAGGLTFRAVPSNSIYSNPWLTGSIGGPIIVYSVDQAKEVAAHEFGHAFDSVRAVNDGTDLPSKGVLYNSYVVRDVNTLDYADPAFTIRRLPCTATPNPAGGNFPGTPPFLGVVDTLSGQNVCNANGTLNDLVLPLADRPWPPGVFNSNVLKIVVPNLWNTTIWVEAHAHLFGYGAVGNLGALPTNDKVLDNGYFPCLKSWATTERGNALPPAACTLVP